jgi:hypothetical protein
MLMFKNRVHNSQKTYRVSITKNKRLMDLLFYETHKYDMCRNGTAFLNVRVGGTYSDHCAVTSNAMSRTSANGKVRIQKI